MMDVRTIARAMGGTVQSGAAIVPGPGHKPHDRSLRVFADPDAPDGFRVHSFAGDDPMQCRDYVRQKIGLPAWQPRAQHTHKNGHGRTNEARPVNGAHKIATPQETENQTYHGKTTRAAALPSCMPPDVAGKPKFYSWGDDGPPRRGNEARRHVYRRDGVPVRIKVKNAPGGDGSAFVNWYHVHDGDVTGWQAKRPDDYRSVPYTGEINPFDSELADDSIFWPEGEKDCDTLGKKNMPAFTFGGCGDGLPNDDIERYLTARKLVILADNDEGGRKHAEDKAARAHAAEAASVRIVHFPELPNKKDVSDFFEAGGTVAELMRRAEAAPIWTPPVDNPTPKQSSGWRLGAVRASELQSMTFPPVRYVLSGYIPEGVTILAGKPKVGKSWLVLDLCIASAAGRFTLGTLKPFPGDVLYLALEDNPRRLKRRIKKLLQALESKWPDRLTLKTEWRRADAGGLSDIEEWCASVPEPTLIVIDTLEKIRPMTNGKLQAYGVDYQAIEGLQKLAGKFGIAIVINHHVRKMDADDPFDTVSGTLGLTGAADTILILKRQSGGITLHARGRDIEESETAVQFDRATCKWTILGAAADVHRSNERAAIIRALETAGDDGLSVAEIMAATESQSRGAIDTLLFKMNEAGEVKRLKRGVYACRKDAGKIGQKERNGGQGVENNRKTGNLTNLTDLSGGEAGEPLGGREP
jgi:hypothetical protein